MMADSPRYRVEIHQDGPRSWYGHRTDGPMNVSPPLHARSREAIEAKARAWIAAELADDARVAASSFTVTERDLIEPQPGEPTP